MLNQILAWAWKDLKIFWFSSKKCGWILVPDHGESPRGAACLIFRAK